MLLLRALVILFLIPLAAAGCGSLVDAPPPPGASEGEGEGEGEEELPPGTPTYTADIAPLLERSCARCHRDGGIAPFPLTDYESAAAAAPSMADATEARRMPPWYAAPGCTEYKEDPSLTEDEIALFAAWASAGAPLGEPQAAAVPAEPVEPPLTTSPEPDVVMPMADTYYVQQLEPDEYRCFVMPWPKDELSFITGFRVEPGQPAVVHHIIAKIIAAADAQALLDEDAANPAPGYGCGAGTSMANGEGKGELAFVWAPGNDGDRYPAGTGIRIEPGSFIRLQIHYNSSTAGPEPDLTTVGFATAPSVEQVSRFIPWMNPAWVVNMNLPAGAPVVDYTFQLDPTFVVGGPFTIHTPLLHMHNLGRKADFTLIDGEQEDCLLDIQNWDFHGQLAYKLAEPRHVNRGEKLRIHCRFDNSEGTEDVGFGEGTGDEMCVGYLYITPDRAD